MVAKRDARVGWENAALLTGLAQPCQPRLGPRELGNLCRLLSPGVTCYMTSAKAALERQVSVGVYARLLAAAG